MQTSQIQATLRPGHTRAEVTDQILDPNLGELLLQNITDCRKLAAVHSSFLELAGESDRRGSGLSLEGFRQALLHGRITLNQLPRLFEAMSVNEVDPAQSLAAIEAACLPRDPDLNGKLSDELVSIAQSCGDIAHNIRTNGDSLRGYSNSKLRALMATAAGSIAVGRKLYQECLTAYTE